MHITSVRIGKRRRRPARWRLVAFTVAVLLMAVARAGRAEEPPLGDVERRLKELEEEVERLKKDQRNTEIALENQKPLAGWAEGFNLASPDGNYKLRIGGYTQLDGRFFVDDRANQNTNQFTFRRARISLEGTVAKYFDFRVLPDFAPSTPILFDAYVDANVIPEAKLRIGKFKPPVGLERLQSATAIEFIERGQPTNLVPSRDHGAQLFGTVGNGLLSYQLAIVNGVPDNSNPSSPSDANDDKDFAGRVFANPFAGGSIDVLKGLGFGLAGSYGRQRGTASSTETPTFKSFGQSTFFSYRGAVAATGTKPGSTATFAFGQRNRWSPQFTYYWGGLGLLGEYVRSAQAMRRDTVDTSNQVLSSTVKTLAHDAWQIAASFVLTGESASYSGVVPRRPFDPFAGKWGAVELAGRYGQLEIDPDAFTDGFASAANSARRDKEWVLGINWYLNKNIKLVLDYAHSDFRGGAANGADRPTENAIETRVQLVL